MSFVFGIDSDRICIYIAAFVWRRFNRLKCSTDGDILHTLYCVAANEIRFGCCPPYFYSWANTCYILFNVIERVRGNANQFSICSLLLANYELWERTTISNNNNNMWCQQRANARERDGEREWRGPRERAKRKDKRRRADRTCKRTHTHISAKNDASNFALYSIHYDEESRRAAQSTKHIFFVLDLYECVYGSVWRLAKSLLPIRWHRRRRRRWWQRRSAQNSNFDENHISRMEFYYFISLFPSISNLSILCLMLPGSCRLAASACWCWIRCYNGRVFFTRNKLISNKYVNEKKYITEIYLFFLFVWWQQHRREH